MNRCYKLILLVALITIVMQCQYLRVYDGKKKIQVEQEYLD